MLWLTVGGDVGEAGEVGVVGTGAVGEVGGGSAGGVVEPPLGMTVVGAGESVAVLARTVIGSAAQPLDAALLLPSPE